MPIITKDHLNVLHLLNHVVGVDQSLLEQHQERGLGGLPHLTVCVRQEPGEK